MSEFENEMLWTIEMLTSDNESYEIASRDIYRKLDIPSPVMDLMFFGRKAGGAVDALSDGGFESIEETCPTLSQFAASLTLRKKFHDKVYALMREITARTISALDTEELADLWEGDASYREAIETIAFVPGRSFCTSLFVDAALCSMVNALENFEVISLEAVKFALKHIDEVACSKFDNNYVVNMIMMRREAINIIEAGETFADGWKEKAIEALFSIDFESEVHLTDENELMTEELVTDILDDADPRNIAITVAWLSAIYLYTEYGDRIVDFFDIDINDVEAEDHQEIADDETPDGLAA
ncbi:conserved protein of unknown function [Pseudodesulfovibrio profundus]|uniref:Uncharacterized protein n=1 Tax=Pseudodesulfovibrio profundus TaxID=57320 RepID=A0A2C8FCZ1_9BACT|nr:hypothetical protein [Pseudodesulfovibrio profundus]SOB60512.1 conserved protein of unknown function [Pseudodesulfovibrio profundus]